MRPYYVAQKLGLAVSGMATDAGSLQSRLAEAATKDLLQLQPDDFTPELRNDFQEIMRKLRRIAPDGTEGRIEESTRDLSDRDARQLIEKICTLFKDVLSSSTEATSRHGQWRPGR